MDALILYGWEVSSKVLELRRWMFSLVVLAKWNDSMSAIYELDGRKWLGLSSSLEQVHSKPYMSLIES